MSFKSHLSNMLLVLTIFALPRSASADVKQGVDAWTQGEYDAAIKEWRDPALKGDPDAQFNMGQAYKMGRGVKTDLSVALDWYKKAAAQGHLQAADSYGHLLHYMGKVPESLPYLQASADRGDPRAQYLLGTELFNGVHIAKDWVKAYALMTRASSVGMGPASRSLAQMDQYIPIEQRQAASAMAGDMEQRASRTRATQVAGFPIDTKPPVKSANAVVVPPAKIKPVAAPGFPSDIPAAPAQPVKAAAVKPKVTPSPTPAKPVAVLKEKAKAAPTDGAWRIQLGAFGDEANARKLWNSLETKFAELAALQPYLKASGGITRLQAGPFASRGAADAICAKVKASGQACISISR